MTDRSWRWLRLLLLRQIQQALPVPHDPVKGDSDLQRHISQSRSVPACEKRPDMVPKATWAGPRLGALGARMGISRCFFPVTVPSLSSQAT